MTRGTWLGAGIGIAVLGLGLGAAWLLRDAPSVTYTPDARIAVANTAQPAARPPAVNTPLPLPQSIPAKGLASGAPAPWATASGPGTNPPNSAGAAVPTTPVAPAGPAMSDIQRRLLALSASKQPNVAELDAVLADMQKTQGGPVVSGVDIQVLRDNLARSQQIQQLAIQMQAMAAAPGPNTQAMLQATMNQMQQLQAGMQSVAPAKAGIPVMPTTVTTPVAPAPR